MPVEYFTFGLSLVSKPTHKTGVRYFTDVLDPLITPFIYQPVCTTPHTPNHPLISTPTLCGVYWCHLQGVLCNCNSFSAHQASDFTRDAEWL